jgi:quercetin dioxygenase-like cupin family protein
MTDWQTLGRSYGVLPPGGGTALTVFGNPFQLMVTGEQSSGSYALIVATFAPGTGALPHLHRNHDEGFYVLDGTFRFRAGDEEIEGGKGSFCFAPRDAAHGFTNVGRTEASLLGVIAPAGYEQHFAEINGITPGPETRDLLAEIFRKYDQESA